jgi:hypothetical protein
MDICTDAEAGGFVGWKTTAELEFGDRSRPAEEPWQPPPCPLCPADGEADENRHRVSGILEHHVGGFAIGFHEQLVDDQRGVLLPAHCLTRRSQRGSDLSAEEAVPV